MSIPLAIGCGAGFLLGGFMFVAGTVWCFTEKLSAPNVVITLVGFLLFLVCAYPLSLPAKPTTETIIVRSETGEEIARYVGVTEVVKSRDRIRFKVGDKTYTYTGGIIEQITQEME